jgi:hypothetical protein
VSGHAAHHAPAPTERAETTQGRRSRTPSAAGRVSERERESKREKMPAAFRRSQKEFGEHEICVCHTANHAKEKPKVSRLGGAS